LLLLRFNDNAEVAYFLLGHPVASVLRAVIAPA